MFWGKFSHRRSGGWVTLGCLDALTVAGGSVTVIAVIGFGILIWILIAILLSLFLARTIQSNRPRDSAFEPSPLPPADKPAPMPLLRQWPGSQPRPHGLSAGLRRWLRPAPRWLRHQGAPRC